MQPIEPTGPWRFAALDVETANSAADSICQIGVALVGFDNRIQTWVSYVNPRVAFSPFNIRVHGIGPDHVADAFVALARSERTTIFGDTRGCV